MEGEAPGSVLLKLKPWLEGDGPFRSPRDGGDPGSPPGVQQDDAAAEASAFSALDLRDRVVAKLLFDQVVTEDQVETAWRRRRQKNERAEENASHAALWRTVARLPGVTAEAVFETAARIYAFKPITARLDRARTLLRSRRARFSLSERRRLVALGVLPVYVQQSSSEAPCWIFATHDPARPAVHALLSDLDVPSYELRYASAAAVREYLETFFPGEVALEERAKADDPQAKREVPPHLKALDALFHEGREESDEPAAQRRAKRGSETARSFTSIYEELLAGAARSGATRVRLSTGDGDRLVATFDYDERDDHRSVALRVPPGAVLSFMRRRVSSARRRPSEQAGRLTHRWVRGRRHSFRIAPLPGRRAWANGTATIRIEVEG